MPEEITYYALVDDYSSREKPGGVVRRIRRAERQQDEAFTGELIWKPTWLLRSAERGDTMNDFYPITEDEAMQIVDRIRRESGSSSYAPPPES
jgi:hypothetical protein